MGYIHRPGCSHDSPSKRLLAQAIALCLGERGCNVVCCDLEGQRASAEGTVAAINASRGSAVFFPADVTSTGDIEGMVAHAVATFGALDISVASESTPYLGKQNKRNRRNRRNKRKNQKK